MFGALRFFEAGRAAGIKPIIGVEAYVAPGSRFERNPGENEEKYHHLTLLAENETGYRNLLKLVSAAYLEGFYHRPRMDKDLLAEHADGVICLSGCLSSELSTLLLAGQDRRAQEAAGAVPRHLRSRSLLHGAAGSRHPGSAPGAPEADRARPLSRHPARRDERPPLHGAERREAARRAALHPAAEAPERSEAVEVRLGGVLPEERAGDATRLPRGARGVRQHAADRRAGGARPGVRGPSAGRSAVPSAALRDAGSQGTRGVPARARVRGRAARGTPRSPTTSAAASTTSWTSSRRWGSPATS